MTIETDPGLVGKVGAFIGTAAIAVSGVIWKMLTGRIDEIKEVADAAVPRIEYERGRAESHTDRQNLRVDIKELFAKTEGVKDLMHSQVAGVEQRLSAEIDRMRSDMNGGFNRMQDLMEKRLKP